MKEQTREEPKILAAAERQMQAWARTAEIAERVIRAEGGHVFGRRMGNYVAISREVGAGGSEIGQRVGQQLGWEVLDKNLLDQVAKRFSVSRTMLELVDETESSWVYDVLGTWMDRQIVPHDKYVAQVGRVILAALHQGNAVLVGRGAQFLLPQEKGLAVRIIAPLKYRIERIMREQGLGAITARRHVEEKDRGRQEFVQRYFHRDAADPHLYDLVVNVECLGPSRAAELIANCVRSEVRR